MSVSCVFRLPPVSLNRSSSESAVVCVLALCVSRVEADVVEAGAVEAAVVELAVEKGLRVSTRRTSSSVRSRFRS